MRLPGKSFFAPVVPEVRELTPIAEPAVMPVPDDEQIKVIKKRKFAKKRQQSGRLSTLRNVPTGPTTATV